MNASDNISIKYIMLILIHQVIEFCSYSSSNCKNYIMYITDLKQLKLITRLKVQK